MAPPKGTTNNPNGRPPKEKSLTVLLLAELNKTMLVDGKRVTGKELLSNNVAKALTTGRLKFPGDESESVLGVKEWMEFCRWAYQYLEPPTTKQELSGEMRLIWDIPIPQPKSD